MAYLLIVDDDEDFAEAAAKSLRDAGHEVKIELATKNAVPSMKARRPDLLILDVMCPEDSTAGFDLARTMQREHETLKSVPVLMLTAVNARFPLGFSSKDIDKDWMPVTDFLEKPVDLDALTERVSEMLARGAGHSKR